MADELTEYDEIWREYDDTEWDQFIRDEMDSDVIDIWHTRWEDVMTDQRGL